MQTPRDQTTCVRVLTSHQEMCGPEQATWLSCASVSLAVKGDVNPPSQGCVRTVRGARGGFTN